MTTDYPARHRELTAGFRTLAEANPSTMDGFGRIHRAATTTGALSQKHKELMALAIAIVIHCDGCIAFHVRDAVRAGATREEVAETVGVAILMGGGPAAVYSTEAMEAYDQFTVDASGETS